MFDLFFSQVLKYLILHRLFSHSVGGWGAGSYQFTDIPACDLVPLSCLKPVRVTPGGRVGGTNPPETLCLFLLSATEILNLSHLHSLCCHLFQFAFFLFFLFKCGCLEQ